MRAPQLNGVDYTKLSANFSGLEPTAKTGFKIVPELNAAPSPGFTSITWFRAEIFSSKWGVSRKKTNLVIE
jgi:hypothetical protein